MKEIFGSKEDLSNIAGKESSPGGSPGTTAAATTDAKGFLAIPGAAPGMAPGPAPGAHSAAEGTAGERASHFWGRLAGLGKMFYISCSLVTSIIVNCKYKT